MTLITNSSPIPTRPFGVVVPLRSTRTRPVRRSAVAGTLSKLAPVIALPTRGSDDEGPRAA
jgi:hypothetical protein